MGLVSQVFDEATWPRLRGHLAIGHARYSTTGAERLGERPADLPLHRHRRDRAGPQRQPDQHPRAGAARRRAGRSVRRAAPGWGAPDAVDVRHRPGRPRCSRATPTCRSRRPRWRCCPRCAAPSRFVFMDENTLYAARDPQGVRPLVLGRLERGWVVASETAALDIVGARFVREIEPGELIAIDEDGLRTQRFADADPKGCLFEYVYLARPDTTIAGRSVHETRVEIGRRLAVEAPGRGRPGHPGARVGHPGRDRLRARRPASRTARAWSRTPTSAAPSSSPPRRSASSASGSSSTRCARSSAASGWSWSTTRSCAATPSARSCGCCARPAPPRSTCGSPRPPVKWPCFYGIDFATRAELIANGLDVDEIRQLDRRRLARLRLARRA